MRLSLPHTEQLIERASKLRKVIPGLGELADLAHAEIEEHRLLVMDLDERRLHRLRERAEEAFWTFSQLRPAVDAVPCTEEPPDEVMRQVFSLSRGLRQIDREAASLPRSADVLEFRHGLRAKASWLEAADMPPLPPIEPPNRPTGDSR